MISAALKFIAIIRMVLFYSMFGTWTAVWSTLTILLIGFLPLQSRHTIFVRTWAIVAIHLSRWICGIKWQVIGRDNIPDTPCVVMCNHQSSWETFFMQALLSPQTTVIKKELLSIPFYGWAFKKINPIAIDRKDPRQALAQVKNQGIEALRNRFWVLIFPEGTRKSVGKLGKFSKGGAGLAKTAHANVLPIAHNAGAFWPNHSWLKTAGTITVNIGSVINTEALNVSEINEAAKEWIETAIQEMPA